MPPPKRRSKPGDIEHHGRVTVPRSAADSQVSPRVEPSLEDRAKRHERGPTSPAPSNRYTPPIKSVRLRPGWHKTVGGLLLALGVAIAIVNDLMLLGPSATLLPGGHNEAYLFLGVGIAGYSTRWFGWFDRAH